MDIQDLIKKISRRFNGLDVSDPVIDLEFGNITATVDGVSFVDCGFVEEYE